MLLELDSGIGDAAFERPTMNHMPVLSVRRQIRQRYRVHASIPPRRLALTAFVIA